MKTLRQTVALVLLWGLSALALAEKETHTVPVGAHLLIEAAEPITTQNKAAGDRFQAVLKANLMDGDTVVIPAGTTVYGTVLVAKRGRIAKKAELELTLTEFLLDGNLIPIKTTILTGEGPKSGAGRKVLGAAAIGALADGHDGAETGAKVGAGLALLAGGKHAGVQAGSLLDFNLEAALTL